MVSVIMASYNKEKYISESINSVINQTYPDWELIISDDGSEDNTCSIVKRFTENDSRIKLVQSSVNLGAAHARNTALSKATGRYIAYLDADDLWCPDKLLKQLDYMRENGYAMCYTSYDIIESNGEFRKTIHIPPKVNYEDFLKKPLTCSHSIMIDTAVVDKQLMIMPDIRRGQDAATWLKILKSGIIGYGLDDSLAKYRRNEGSLSSNKLKAVKRTWYLYREVEKLSFVQSTRYFISYAFNAAKKYI